jgi:hypothetical protein
MNECMRGKDIQRDCLARRDFTKLWRLGGKKACLGRVGFLNQDRYGQLGVWHKDWTIPCIEERLLETHRRYSFLANEEQ